ncbi:hypothetical protein [Alistipes putredinis]|uniref:hypothetical protein n=1 Tax=Alistipes putredinis TaxID=28117 RepID=UPI003AF86D98
MSDKVLRRPQKANKKFSLRFLYTCQTTPFIIQLKRKFPMKRLIFIIASILLGQTVCAQDIIQKKDATEIQAKVLKITDTEIEYQRWDNPDGPIYTIPAEDVFTITYQNGSKEVISHFDSSRRSAADKQQFGKLPRYQGEVAFAYGSAVSEGMQDLFPRIVFETVHGVRINPYLFAGVGLGINYFYKDIYFSNGWNIYELGNSGTVLPVFANVKGYLPVSSKAALNLSWDLGAAIGVGGYFNEGTEFYTSIGPGVTFGRQSGGVRGDFRAHGRRIECHPVPHRNRILKYVRQIFKHGTSRLFEIIGESKPKRLSATCRQPLHIIPDIPSTLDQ